MEDLGLLLDFLDARLVIIAVVLYLTGMYIKPFLGDRDNFLPLILWGIGIVLNIMYLGFYIGELIDIGLIVVAIIQGCIASAIAVYGNQILVQLKKHKEVKKEKV